MRGPNFTKLGEDIRRSFVHEKFVSEFGYQTRAAQSWMMFKAMPNFELFDFLWKLGEGWTRSLYQLLKLYLRPNHRNTFADHPLRGCWARCIHKKEKKRSSASDLSVGRPKESLWVKFNAFLKFKLKRCLHARTLRPVSRTCVTHT